nr:MAG TPA: hypothetical protein [Caudoviricetes sp.]
MARRKKRLAWVIYLDYWGTEHAIMRRKDGLYGMFERKRGEIEFAPRLVEKFEPSRRLQQKRLDKLACRLGWGRRGVISDAV